MCGACGSVLGTRAEHAGVRAASSGPIRECAVNRTGAVLGASVTVVSVGAPWWSAAGPGRVVRAPWVVWGYVGTVERAFSASLAHLGLRPCSFHSKVPTVTRIWCEYSAAARLQHKPRDFRPSNMSYTLYTYFTCPHVSNRCTGRKINFTIHPSPPTLSTIEYVILAVPSLVRRSRSAESRFLW